MFGRQIDLHAVTHVEHFVHFAPVGSALFLNNTEKRRNREQVVLCHTGSNGLTSARHDVFAKYLATQYPESYDAAVPDELVYSGGLKLTDKIEELGIDAGKLVLSPTRTYAPVIKVLLDKLPAVSPPVA